MSSCREIEALITTYLDAQAGEQGARVGAHLEVCDRCRALAAAEAGGRLILRERAPYLRIEAPAGLRVRCRPSYSAPALRSGWLTFKPLSLSFSAALLLLVAALAVWAGGGTRVLAAGLTLDHLKCFTLFGPPADRAEPSIVADDLKSGYGMTVTVPPTSPAIKLTLVGGRRCFSTEGRVAHILYRHDGHPLSLFVVPESGREAQEMAVLGHETVIWSARGMTYAVVAREPRVEVERVAAYMREAATPGRLPY